MTRTQTYSPLTPQMVINLAAPHTWAAALMPVFVVSCEAALVQSLSVGLVISVLCIVVLMQSAANIFNDFFDFVKGRDTKQDYVEASDSVLVYNNINPRSVLILGISFLVLSFVIGIYIVVQTGVFPLFIAIIGAFFVVVYSAGKTPLSYLPLGEIISGLCFGGLVPLAAYYVFTHQIDPIVVLWGIPEIIGVALIMLTNNTCDIEQDRRAERHTLSVILGRQGARRLYRVCLVVWLVCLCVIAPIYFKGGIIVLPFMLLASYPQLKLLCTNSFMPDQRLKLMPTILSLNIILGLFHGAIVLGSAVFSFVF